MQAILTQRDEIRFLHTARLRLDLEKSMSRLLDVDSCARERRLLSRVTLESDTGLLVLDVIGSDRRVVRNLLGNENSLTLSCIRPLTIEQLAENGVERLLF